MRSPHPSGHTHYHLPGQYSRFHSVFRHILTVFAYQLSSHLSVPLILTLLGDCAPHHGFAQCPTLFICLLQLGEHGGFSGVWLLNRVPDSVGAPPISYQKIRISSLCVCKLWIVLPVIVLPCRASGICQGMDLYNKSCGYSRICIVQHKLVDCTFPTVVLIPPCFWPPTTGFHPEDECSSSRDLCVCGRGCSAAWPHRAGSKRRQ